VFGVVYLGNLGWNKWLKVDDMLKINNHTLRICGALLLIIVLAFVIRIVSFSGFNGADDEAYAELGYRMSQGDFQINDKYLRAPVFPLRVALITPVSWCLKIAGVSETAILFYPFLLSMLSVILVFIAGCIFFDSRSGLIAAAIQAILPIDAVSASALLPDLPAAFWANMGVLICYYASRRSENWIKISCGILSGLALAISYLCKESVVFVLIFICIFFAYLAYRHKRNAIILITIGVTFITVLLAESFVYYQSTGDFFHRLHETERNYEVCKYGFFTEGSPWGWEKGEFGIAIKNRLFKEGPKKIFMTKSFGWIAPAAMLALIYAVMRKLRKFAFPATWFLFLVLIFNFGSSSLTAYRPLVLVERHFYPILFPAVLLAGGLIGTLLSAQRGKKTELGRERFFWGCVISLAILYICTAGISKNIKAGPLSKMGRTAALELTPQDVIYTDSRTARVLRFFWEYPHQDRIKEISGRDAADISPGSRYFSRFICPG